MKKHVIIINGIAGSGKDTFVQFCSEFCKVKNTSSIDPIKNSLKTLVGIDYIEGQTEKTDKLRKLMSDLKKLAVNYNSYPAHYVLEQVDEFEKDTDDNEIMFIHCREIFEIEKIYQNIKMHNPKVEVFKMIVINKNLNHIPDNFSDKNAEGSHEYYDFMINNNETLEDLKVSAKYFIDELH